MRTCVRMREVAEKVENRSILYKERLKMGRKEEKDGEGKRKGEKGRE